MKTKPIVVVSKCLEFAECRYNGDVLSDQTVRSLAPFVTFIPVCPEIEIGLGIPRETIRIMKEGEQHRLVQPSTRADLSQQMNSFADAFLQNVGEVDGFILKSRSPSCGVKDVKVYSNIVANHEKKEKQQVWNEYAALLPNMFKRAARYTSNINVCEHIMGHFSTRLSTREKDHFKHLLHRYRERKLPLSSMTSLLKSWVFRYEQEYLLQQRFFEPYPEELIDLGDSGKGRDY
ncbi:DUF523 and DUF1722 domain-containing protein [Brevibacillus laterosporus]